MPYVGKTPVVGNFVKLDAIVTSATATYNLLNGGVAYFPQTANNCIVSLNGVIQSPTSAYTISGSTIVFSDALTASDSIDFILVLGDVLAIGTPSDATVNTAKLTTDLTVTHALGSVSLPSITFTGDTNTGIYSPTADTIGFAKGGTEAMRILSGGDVVIGTTTSQVTQFGGAATGVTIGSSTYPVLSLWDTTNASYNMMVAQNDGTGYLWNYANGSMLFATNNLERMRIESGGDILIGKTASGLGTAGVQMSSLGSLTLTRSGSEGINLNRLTSDGNLIRFYQDGTEEGQISVSGTTVTYSAFTGSHWSRFAGDSKPDVLRGTVMESLDQMIDWYAVEFEVSKTENDEVKTHTEHKPYALKANEQEGDVITYAWNTGKKDEDDNDIIEQVQATIVKEKDVKHMMSKISDTNEAKNVYGVFHAWDNDDLINNDFYVASVGSYVVRIKAGQTVSKGDLLQSNGDGTAKVQADDLVRASSFAKVLSNTVIDTYEDGSFIVPCSLMC